MASFNINVDDAFKRLQLDECTKQYFDKSIRIDGRKFHEFRDILINIDSISTCDSSSIVKLGNTSIICGIKIYENSELNQLEQVTYKDLINLKIDLHILEEDDNNDYKIVLLEKIIKNEQLFDPKCLIIDTSTDVRIYFSMLIEFIGLNNDGNLLDACLIALISSLNSCPLPSPSSTISQASSSNFLYENISLKVYPISITSLIIDHNTILVDPCLEEELLGNGFLTIVFDANSDKILLIDKKGGLPLSESLLSKQLNISKPKSIKFLKLIKSLKEKKSVKLEKL